MVGDSSISDPDDSGELADTAGEGRDESVKGSDDGRERGGDDGSDGASGSPISLFRLLRWSVFLLVFYVGLTFVDIWYFGTRTDDAYSGDASAAVVLGAAQYNGSPSAALQGRLDRAGDLYAADQVGLVVVTGGGQEADETTEAKTGYDYLRENYGLPDEALRLEVQGRSTYESLAAAERFLQNEEISEVVLVTDPYHARRSQLIAKEVGLEADVASTDAGVPTRRLLRETAAVAVGRVIGFRRIDAYWPG